VAQPLVAKTVRVAYLPLRLWFYKGGTSFFWCMGPEFVFHEAHSPTHSAISQHPNHLQVTIDILYQYAIMVS
jgi:hypothetical protein